MAITETLSDASGEVRGGLAVGPFVTQVFSCRAPLDSTRRFALDTFAALELGRGDAPGHRVESGEGGHVLRVDVADTGMSTVHARIRSRGRAWTIEDAGSKNGTVVNGAEVTSHELEDGDVVELGQTFFLFRAQQRGLGQSGAVLTAADLDDQPRALATFNPALEHEFDVLRRVAASRLPILVHGETGSGKELLARAIHIESRRTGDIVAVNCGALAESILESELFGARKGAFSGADADRVGLVRAADGGTLFLDEIAELSEASQVALLRVLQEREVLPVGATRPEPVDIRVVAATHRDLVALRETDRFRDDLYARIAAHVVTLPPLRHRREDLGLLLRNLLREIDGQASPTLSRRAGRRLLRYGWPLNIRELDNALRSALLVSDGGELTSDHLPAPGGARPGGAGRERETPDSKREKLVELLVKHEGNVSAVARELATSRTQIARLMRRFRIDKGEYA